MDEDGFYMGDTDGLSVSMMHNRGGLALGALDLDSKYHIMSYMIGYNNNISFY